jgi:error-prone DNA polymerase
VRPVDVGHSEWDCTLESRCDSARPAVRLGLRMVSGLAQAVALRVVSARAKAPFSDVEDLARRAALESPELQQLAQADALQSLAGHRRAQLWAATGLGRLRRDRDAVADVLSATRTAEPHTPDLFEAPEAEAITLDYAATGLTLRRHPLALLRERLNRRGWRSAQQLQAQEDGKPVWACGLVTMRQQPATAKGTVFVTLEDETGCVNVIVWRHLRERQRLAGRAGGGDALAGFPVNQKPHQMVIL